MEENQTNILSLPERNRGKHTQKFKVLSITTNHFQVSVKENLKQIFIFSVKFDPRIPSDNTKLRRQLLTKIPLKDQVVNPVISGYNVFSTQEPKEIEKEYVEGDQKIAVKLVKTYKISEDKRLLLTFLNNGMRNIMSALNYVQIGRSGKYFSSKDKTEIDSLTMFNGFKVNFVSLEKSFFLRVDPAKKIVRNQTALGVINIIYKRHQDKDKDQKRQLVKEEFVNRIVMSNYGKTQYYKIIDVQFLDLKSVVLEDGLTLIEYYSKKYGITISNPKQPLLVAESRKTRSIYLIPELMLMTGIPEDFDERRRKTISEKTIKDPSFKVREINSLIDLIKDQEKIENFKDLGLKIKFSLEKIEAKLIPSPTLELGNNNSVQKGKQSFFNLFSKPIYNGKHDVSCSIIYSKDTDIRELEETIKSTAPKLGVKVQMNYFKFNRSEVCRIKEQINKACQKDTKICLIVLPVSLKGSYKDIKSHAIIKQEIATQVVLQSTLRKKGVKSIVTKVLLQMIAKRGNILWVPKISVQIEQSVMLVGFQEAKMGSKTLLAICATLNSTFTMVFTQTTIYEGQNRHQQMKKLLLLATAAYAQRNKDTPSEIVCYQNSCPHDQIVSYHNLFIQPFNEQVELIYKDKKIAMTVVMVNVKTSQRFFSERDGRPENPPAGTLINQTIVSENYDFYLISQKPTRGTSVPNHYKVIFCNSKMEEGILQEIIFSQCFNYVNWTGSIKVPGILQYARKAANFHVDVLNDKEAPESLLSRLYYI